MVAARARAAARGVDPAVRARRAAYGFAYPELLTPAPIATGGPALELVYTHPHVELLLLDAEGRPRTGALPDADEAAVRARERSSTDEAWLQRLARSAEVELRAPGRRPVPVQRVAFLGGGTSGAGSHLTTRFELNTTVETELLPAGRFTLVARLPGGRVARAPVELLPGQTTAVTLRFD